MRPAKTPELADSVSIAKDGTRRTVTGIYEAAVKELFLAEFRPEDIGRFSRALDAAAAKAGWPK
ncbi:MAG: hypothetical protein ACN6OP_15315 [Pseudomonadales bacterium]